MKLNLCLWAIISSASAFSVSQPKARRSLALPRLAAYVNIDESAERDIGTMDEWATACGVQRVGGFQLTSEDGMDFSVMTTEDLAEGSPILYVPSELILSSSRVREEMGGAIQNSVEQLNRLGANEQLPQFYLFVKILTMYEMGDQSPWYPWLNSLPRLFYNAVSMTSKSPH